jgi:dUTP pyrophosphatase
MIKSEINISGDMKVDIRRIDKSLPLPVYETAGSVGFDILCREGTTVQPKAIALIPSNFIVKVPEGYMLMIVPRSSTPRKKSLVMPHSVGILDNDYCGPDDELMVQVYNFSDKPVEVDRGEKIAQGIFVKVDKAKWEEVDEMSEKSRGGFGSTG